MTGQDSLGLGLGLGLPSNPKVGNTWNGQLFTLQSGTNFPYLGFAQFTVPSIAVWDAGVSNAKLDARLANGFDHVNIQFDPHQAIYALATNAVTLDIAFHAIDQVISRGLKAWLRLMVNDDAAVRADYPNGPKWLALISFVKDLAVRSLPYSNQQLSVALYNETTMAVGTGWPTYIEPIWTAYRAVNRNTMVWVPPAFYASPDGLAELTPSHFDGNTGYSVGMYEPNLVAQQGYPISEIGVNDFAKPFRRLNYPPVKNEKTASITAAKAIVDTTTLSAGDKTTLKASIDAQGGFYFDNPRNLAWLIARKFSLIDTFIARGVPGSRTAVQEFGTKGDNGGANGGSIQTRSRLTQDIDSQAAKRGMGRSEYADQDGNYFSVTSGGVVLPEILAAMNKVSATAFDSEATALFARGGTISNQDKSFVNAVVRMWKDAGLMTGIYDEFACSGFPGLETVNWMNSTWGGLSDLNGNAIDPVTKIFRKSASNARIRVNTNYTPGQATALYGATGHMSVTLIDADSEQTNIFSSSNGENALGVSGNIGSAISANSFSTYLFNDTPYTDGKGTSLLQRTGATATSGYVEGQKLTATSSQAYKAQTPSVGNPLSLFNGGALGLGVICFSMGAAMTDAQARDDAIIKGFIRTQVMRKYGLL